MGLFGSKLRIPMRNMLPPDTEDTPATYPAMQVKDPGPTPMRPKGLFGGSYAGPQLNKWQVIGATLQQLGDNRGQLNDLYQMEDQRQRAAFERQRQEQMMAALADDPNIPESVRGFLPYAPEAVLSGVIGGRMKQAFPDEPKALGPLATSPGTELVERDPRTGMPIIDPATGKPRVIYTNQNWAPRPERNDEEDSGLPPGFVLGRAPGN